MSFDPTTFRGRSHITSAAGGEVSKKLTIADEGGRHSEAILELFK